MEREKEVVEFLECINSMNVTGLPTVIAFLFGVK